MEKHPISTFRRGSASARTPRMTHPPGDPDYRAVALRLLADFLTAGAEPVKGRTPMPAPPRLPAGGAAMPRPGRPAPPMPASPPPRVPFPALPPPAAAGGPPRSALAAIERFVEAARAGRLAAYRRRRG